MRKAPASPAQEGMWFLHQLAPDSPFYNVPLAIAFDTGWDPNRVAEAVQALVARHDALRATYALEDGQPVQRIAEHIRIDVSFSDVRRRPGDLQRIAQEEFERPFDLEAGPLLRAHAVSTGIRSGILVLTLHHSVCDRWSLNLIRRELRALVRGDDLPPAAQHGDFARWQLAALESGALAVQLEWWRRRLAGAPDLIDLPLDRPRPANASFRGGSVRHDLPPELSQRLAALARDSGATLYMALLAGLALLLHRHSGQDDLVIGSWVAGRNRSEYETVIGPLANTLPVRIDLTGNPTFRELLERVRESVLGALDNQDVRIETLVRELAPARTAAHMPLCQVVLTHQNFPDETLAARRGPRRAAAVEVQRRSTKYDLVIVSTGEGSEEGIRLLAEYSSDLFDSETVARLLQRLQLVFEQVLEQPARPLAEVELLSAVERQQLLVEWNRTQAEFPDRPLHQLFSEQTAATPDAVALRYRGQSVTYLELEADSDRVAHRLLELGVQPGDVVGLCGERSPAMVVGMLGAMKAGAAYLPLDPAYPKERLAYMLVDSRANVLMTTGEPGLEATARLRLDGELGSDAGPVAETAGEIAYVIYTSGSTGRPKGVRGRHRATVNRLAWMWRAYPFEAGDTCCQKTAISFVDSIWEIFGPLLRGVPNVILPDEDVRDPHRLLQRLRREEVTRIVLVPSLLRSLLAAEPELGTGLPALRTWVTSGEALPGDLAARFLEAHPEALLLNLYGSSEVAADATFYEVESARPEEPVPIGRPIANTRVYLLDRNLRPVPIGVRGEIFVAGDCLSAGYIHQPGMTAERFVELDLGSRQLAYRTGDLGRWRRDGMLEYAGRADQQVKIRGFRVEPAEIEAALEEVDSVEGALVVPRRLAGDLQLVAYVATGAGPELVEELRAACSRRLPAHMHPAAYVTLSAFPLTPNGKIDRLALPSPPEQDPLSGGYVAPRSKLESSVAAVFADVLRLKQVGAHDDFFRLGGHSLTATQAVSRLRAQLQREIPLVAIFEAGTPARLAEWLESTPELAPAPALEARPEAPLAPVSYGQHRLWFLDRLAPGSPAYHIPQTFRFSGEVDAAALEGALNTIVARHEVLRTTFTAVDGEPRQRIAPELRIRLHRHDLRALSESERQSESRRLARDNFRQPFDLARGPLIRATLVRLAEADWVLFTCLHHIVSDGWSMEIFDRELRLLYDALRTGAAPALADLPIQYADFAAWQRGRGVDDAELRNWVERLRGAPPIELPTDRPRPAVQSLRGQRLVSVLSEKQWQQVVRFSQDQGVTPFMTLLTAFYAVLHRLSGQEDLVVGTPVAGRGRIETEPLIGFFVNTLALRVDLAGEPSFAALLERVRAVAIEGFAHQDLPFERLVEELAQDRDLSRSPVFQVMFVLQNQAQAALEGLVASGPRSGDLRRVHWALDRYASKFDLTLTASELKRGLRLQLEYAVDLFRPLTMRRLIERFRVLLGAALESPSMPVAVLPILAPGEEELLEGWSGIGRTKVGSDETLHGVFARRVAERPDAVALVSGDRELTYAELDRESNRLARHLAATRAVGRGDRVGVCFERTPELVISLLAVLKLGAAYLPLDPSSPPDRLALMLRDANAIACIAGTETARGLKKAPCSVLLLDKEMYGIAERRADAPGRAVATDDIAYVLYTSGSTGKPKGVLVEHRHVLGYARSVARRTGATAPGIRYAMLQPLTVDSSVTPLWGSLLGGGQLHLIDRDLAADAQRLATYFHARRIDHLKIAPSHLRALHAAGDPEALMPRRWLVIGGEGSPWSWVRQLPKLRPGCQVFNHYGPTETTVGVTMFPVNGNRLRRYDITPIGTPLAFARAYVLDGRGQRVPIGVRGELHFGGACVARGYLNRPQLTGERFLPDPYGHGRMYRTGDAARLLPRGVIEFLGRLDHQVKIRGFRIELGEIEAVLARHPAVETVTVQARGSEEDKRVVAYLVGREPGLDTEQVRDFARRHLPEHMVPSALVSLHRLPLTPHGKVDLNALPEPEAPAPRSLVPPSTPTQKALAAIWCEVLDIPEVGIDDRFFDLGGHSLLATQVISRVRDRLGVELPLRAIFEQPALTGLAAVVDALRR
ncbi:MAG TPA: amino acid adenylation domain-containing protein [Candidatus Dormibacteraeota bacterium]